MKLRFFAIGIALVAMTGFYSCGDDEVDAPSDGTEQQDPTDPDDSTDPDDGSGDEAGEDPDPGPFVPPTILEPLSKDVRPELTDGKRWVKKSFRSDGTIREYSYFVDGDVVVHGYNAKKFTVFEDGKYSHNTLPAREEDGIVYYFQSVGIPGYVFPPEAELDQCDFLLNHLVNPTEGKIYEGTVQDVKLLSRGTMVLQGIERRTVKVEALRGYDDGRIDYWVEGIGPLFGIAMDCSYVWPTCGYRTIEDRLMQCYDGDKLIYDYSEFREELYNEIEVFEYPE